MAKIELEIGANGYAIRFPSQTGETMIVEHSHEKAIAIIANLSRPKQPEAANGDSAQADPAATNVSSGFEQAAPETD